MLAANGCSLDVSSNIFFSFWQKKKGAQDGGRVCGCVGWEAAGGGNGWMSRGIDE